MANSTQYTFTEEEYRDYCNSRQHSDNERYRSVDETLYQAMKSTEADFTETEEGKGALSAIVAFGKAHG